MGFFSDRYNRPGPGIEKDEPQKRAVPRFFEVYFRKFFDLIKLNLLFVIPVVVSLVLIFLLVFLLSPVLAGQPFAGLLVGLPLVLLWPFLAGLTIVTRNYAREEHAFIFSDFKDAVKNNWKPFLIDGIICYLVYAVMSVAINYYFAQAKTNNFFFVPLAICLCFTVMFVWAHFYIPTMLVTFDMKLKPIYKNAFIFSIVGLWRNLLLTLIFTVFGFIFWLLFHLGPLFVLIALVLLLFLFFSFAFFLINFATYPMLKKFMIDPHEKAQDKVENPEEDYDEDDDDDPEYEEDYEDGEEDEDE